MRLSIPLVLLLAAGLLPAQTLSIYSGNGQIVEELYLSPVPLVVQATGASGKPAAGVAVTWTATPANNGTLHSLTNVTDANGLASNSYLATTNGSLGASFVQSAITATSASNSVNFVLTVSLSSSSVGGLGAPPLVQLLTPAPGATLTGPAGSTLPGAIKIRVVAQSGYQAGQPIPNVGVLIPPNAGFTQPPAMCNGPAGVTLTDATGVGTCDLILGPATGLPVAVTAEVGDITYTPAFDLNITPAIACTYTVTPTSQSFGAGGGQSTVAVSSGAGCSWTAGANESWLAITSGSSGSGNGTVAYSVAANGPTARSGTLTIAGQTVSISEAGAAGPSSLTIAAANLPEAPLGSAYSAQFTASGGTPPYTWSSNGGLPPGLSLNSTTGSIGGTPTTTGTYSFAVTVTDSLNQSTSQTFTITVAAGSGFLITNAPFPQGVVGVPYSQALTTTGGCPPNPFDEGSFTVLNGALPPGLTIQSSAIAGTPTMAGGPYSFTLQATDACGNKATAGFSITVTSTATPVLTPTPKQLSFVTAFMSASALPAQTISLSPGNVAFTAVASTTTGGNWLIVSASGTTPGPLTVSIGNTSQLNVGAYSGIITVSSPSVSPLVIPVTLTVTYPVLNVSPQDIAITLPNAGSTTSQTPIQFTTGGAPINFTASVTASGSWLSVTPVGGTGPLTLYALINAAGLSPGIHNGTIQLVTAYANFTVNVTLTVVSSDLLLSSPANLSFTGPSGSGPVSQNLTITTSGPAANVTFTASVATGSWLSVTPSSGTAPVTVTVSANPSALTVGNYVGSITVQSSSAGIASITVPVNFAVTVPSAAPQVASITNAASSVPGPVAPGELLTIYGTGIGPPSTAIATINSSGIIDGTLAGIQVLFDGNPAPIVYASSTQVNAIAPYEIASDASTIFQIVYNGVKSNTINLRVVEASPAVFTIDAAGQGAILNQDSTLNSEQNGAAPGTVVSIYATGAGTTNPAGVDGRIAVAGSLSVPVLPVTASIGGEEASVLYAGDAPGLASGMLQVNVTVPANLTPGTQVPVELIVGGYTSPAVRMWIK